MSNDCSSRNHNIITNRHARRNHRSPPNPNIMTNRDWMALGQVSASTTSRQRVIDRININIGANHHVIPYMNRRDIQNS